MNNDPAVMRLATVIRDAIVDQMAEDETILTTTVMAACARMIAEMAMLQEQRDPKTPLRAFAVDIVDLSLADVIDAKLWGSNWRTTQH
jgi:hypothetical protein